LKIEFIDSINLAKKKKEVLPEMIDRIFAVCKNDPNFKIKNKIDNIDNITESVNLRIVKQNSLLENAKEIEEKLNKKLSILDDSIFDMKSKLLESLGSEL